MKLFTEKIDGRNNIHYDYAKEDLLRNAAQIRFEIENPSLQNAVKEIFNSTPDVALCVPDKYDNPNLFIDEIYFTLYGKSLDEMYKDMGYDDSWENRKKTGAKPWNKERVLSTSWNLFIISLYTFYISTDSFSSDSWENLSEILTLLKDLSPDEWKRMLFGKTTNYIESVQNFWEFIEVIVCKKYRNIVKEDATRVINLSEIKKWISDKNCNELQRETYDCFVLQIDNEFDRLRKTQSNLYECLYEFQSSLDIVAGYNAFFIDCELIKNLNSYISNCFMRLGDICALNHMYELSNRCYINALVYVNNQECEKVIRSKNKKICKHIPKNKQLNENEEKRYHRRMSDGKYNNKIHKIKDIAEKVLIPSVVIFALATIVFLILMIIGLIVSKGLFAFSWKALLASLGLTILSFVSLYYTTEKL